MRLARILFALLVPLLLAQAPAEARQSGIKLSAEQAQAVGRINDYFNSFQTLRGDFIQTGSKGQTARGVMMIAKPGKIRFEYAPPSALLMVSDGKWLTIKNKFKDTGDQFPLSATPLRLVPAPALDLARDTAIINVADQNGLTIVTLTDPKDETGSKLILAFDPARNMLQQWQVIDGKGRRTTVDLANLETGVALDPKLFKVTLKRPEFKNNR